MLTARDLERSYRFTGPLEELDYGRMKYWVVYLPQKLEGQRPFSQQARLRIQGSVGGEPVSLALLPMRGRHYLLISRALARKVGARPGARVRVAFTLATEDTVPMPPELVEALRQEPAWSACWQRLTPGARRGISHRVNSAKRPFTRVRRAVEALRSLASSSPLASDDETGEVDEGVSRLDPDLADADDLSQ